MQCNLDAEVHISIPKVDHAIPSLHKENILNYWGHYAHDKHQLPFASFLYDRPQEELEQEQMEYLVKMKEVCDNMGAWHFFDNNLTIGNLQQYQPLS